MPELPQGTVTLLFSDIEGSTRLLDRLGSAYPLVLAEHRALLREAVSGHGGVEVGTEGDSFFVVFARAENAVLAAAQAQRLLAAHSWPDSAEVRVRMGIHTGTPELVGSDYVGMDVHRAARVMAAGHGEQVLLTHSTASLLPERLPPVVAIRALGAHRLKDVTQAEQLYQLVIEGLPSEFPPLRTLDAPLTNLPVQATSFIGREHELEEVARLLARDDVLVLTLTGPGGIGKSRLALEAAAGITDRYEDGVWWVPLALLREPELVLEEVAQTLGARDELARHIGEKQLLLVLDNLEHLLAASSDLAALLGSCPKLRMLVTSREPLHISGEWEYPLDPLRLEEAVALFGQRMAAVRRDIPAGEEIAAICRRLDCLPLAIELAAASVKALSPAAILRRLEQRLPLLSGAARNAPERQRTLRATIEWSYDLLAPEERWLFADLAVFAGGCVLEAVEEVCDTDLETLESLVDKSLLRRDGDRYSMLETIHEYAAERLLSSDRADDVRAAHAAYFLAEAESAAPELTGGAQTQLLDRLEDDHANFRAVLDWAQETGDGELAMRLSGALWRFWLVRGHLAEGREWLASALAAGVGSAPEIRERALFGASVLASVQGEAQLARELAEQRLAVVRTLDDVTALVSALSTLANICSDEGGYETAATMYEEAAELARSVGDDSRLAGVITNLAYLALRQRDWDRAAALASEALPLFRATGHTAGSAVSLLNLGLAAIHQGRWRVARENIEASIGIYGELGDPDGLSNCLEGLAAVSAAEGDSTRAAVLLGAAEKLRDEIGASLQPHEAELHADTLAAIAADLDDSSLAAAWARGAQLGSADAVAFAGAP
jgi:predicted ATPase/class 3 adenylate cyclase